MIRTALITLALLSALPCSSRTRIPGTSDPGSIVLEKGGTLMVPRGMTLDGCLTVEAARAGLLTGRYPVRSGMYGDRVSVLFPDTPRGLPQEKTPTPC